MENFDLMENFEFGRQSYWVVFAVLIFLVFFFTRRRSSSKTDRTDFSKQIDSVGFRARVPELKDSYTTELRRATLLVDAGKLKVPFDAIDDVELDSEYFPEVTLRRRGAKKTDLSLGALDLLVCSGDPAACEFDEPGRVRVWAGEKLIYDELLADVDTDDRYVNGYTKDGSDTCLVLGPGLTLCIEEI